MPLCADILNSAPVQVEYIGQNSPKVEKTVKVDRFSTADLQIGWIQW